MPWRSYTASKTELYARDFQTPERRALARFQILPIQWQACHDPIEILPCRFKLNSYNTTCRYSLIQSTSIRARMQLVSKILEHKNHYTFKIQTQKRNIKFKLLEIVILTIRKENMATRRSKQYTNIEKI